MKKIIFLLFFISAYCYPQREKTLWEMAFDNFLLENGKKTVFYTTISYINPESGELIKALFIYKLSNSNGIILYTDGEYITNYFTVIYSDEYDTLICYDVAGGLFSGKQADNILRLALKSTLHISICKDLRQLALPNDGLLKF